MKSTRKLLALTLALVLCLALFPASASAAGIMAAGNAGPGGASNAEFILYTDGRLVISGTGTVGPMNQWSFSSWGGYASAADARVQTRSEVKELVIEEGIRQIGDGAFQECPKLVSVDLPISLTNQGGAPAIGSSAFQNCSSLNYVYIPNNVQTIGASAFRGCTGLTDVYLSDGLQRISDRAFFDCTALRSITIPANVNAINTQAFANCNSLKTITFTGNWPNMANDAFQNVKATTYYPVDNDSWNQNLTPLLNANQADFGGRLSWQPSTEYTESDGWVRKGTTANPRWYYYMNGVMVRNNWVAYEGYWFYFGDNGQMLTGRQMIDGKYYYLDPNTGARQSGWRANEYYDEYGVWQPAYSGVNDSTLANLTFPGTQGIDYFRNGWQQLSDGKWFYIQDKAKVTGWLQFNGYWYYLDPTTGAMVTGWLTWNGNTYYLRPLNVAQADNAPEGSMIAGCTERIGDAATGQYYTFDGSGALLGGRADANPMGNTLNTGWRQDLDANGNPNPNGGWYFYRSDGSQVKGGWELISNGADANNGNKWYYFNDNGTMKTGWLNWNGGWYYLTTKIGNGDPRTTLTGQMVTGFQDISTTPQGVQLATPKTYYFKSNGELNGKGWILVNNKWYYLREDGSLHMGWLREGANWYYLDDGTQTRPNGTGTYNRGEMVTGVVTIPATCNGEPNAWTGQHSFKSNGVWIDYGANGLATTAGGWNGDKYFDTDGVALSGWQYIDGKWYYLNPAKENKRAKGWVNDPNDGNWYYCDQNGVLQTGWLSLDGTWYLLSSNSPVGARLTGWQWVKDSWYYLDPNDGGLRSGWLEDPVGSGTMYYLREVHDDHFGAMVTGTQTIGGKTFTFADDGHLIG